MEYLKRVLLCSSLFLSVIGLPYRSAEASLKASALDTLRRQHDPKFAEIAKLFTEAIAFSLLNTEARAKVSGPYRPHIEAGYHVFDVNEQALAPYTSNLYSPSSFQSIFVKAGTGLPFGMDTELGFSQVISEHKLSGVYGTLTFQVADFSTLVYTDLVPAITASATVLRSLSGPAIYNFVGQGVIGAYHRKWLSQFGYIFQYNYAMLAAINPSEDNQFIRHGIVTHIPLIEKVFSETQVFFPTLSASVTLGYQF